MNKTIITCGTSLLTNNFKDRGIIYDFSNCAEETLPCDKKALVDGCVSGTMDKLSAADNASLAKSSAELNTLISYYGDLSAARGEFYFLHTDTYFGKCVAEFYASFLKKRFGAECQAKRVPGLRTDSYENFNRGLSALYSDEFLKLYKNPSGKVIFVLSGGFKSWSGYMQSIGMFYADEILYQFESGAHLVSIPKIPVKLDLNEKAEKGLRLIEKEKDIPAEIKKEIPAVAFEDDGGKLKLTNMGKLLLDRVNN